QGEDELGLLTEAFNQMLDEIQRHDAALRKMNVDLQEEVAERKRAEKALRESEERFRSVAQSASDAIIIADAQGKILTWNNGAQSMFGYGAGEVIGQQLSHLMPERYREAHEK